MRFKDFSHSHTGIENVMRIVSLVDFFIGKTIESLLTNLLNLLIELISIYEILLKA